MAVGIKTRKKKLVPKSPVFDVAISDTELKGMVVRRQTAATAHWDKKFGLTKIRENNNKLYTGDYRKDKIDPDNEKGIFGDNRIFVAVRTLLPYLTNRITAPEITPANKTAIARQFAGDFEKILAKEARDAYAKSRIKNAVQDVLKGQRVGVLKWRFDPAKDKLALEYCSPDSIIVDNTPLHDEPQYVCHTQEMTIGAILRKFPDKRDAIYKMLGIERISTQKLEEVRKVGEHWMFVDDEDGNSQLIICWMLDEVVLGAMEDSLFDKNGNNLIEEPMMPFIFFNFLTDGSGYIDETSFLEQAELNQRSYDQRGQTISDNAVYGGTGIPIFSKDALDAEEVAKVKFTPEQRLQLDTDDVSKAFAVWKGGEMQTFVVADKYDTRNNIDNIFGTPNIVRGEQSKNNTLGQDDMLQNASENRSQEMIDGIDDAMRRFYLIEAQMIARYYTSERQYNIEGENGDFDELILSSAKLRKNLGISIGVDSGSCIPINRHQLRDMAMDLAKMRRISTKTLYQMVGVPDADQAYDLWLKETVMPFMLIKEADEALVSREAVEDLDLVIGGRQPIVRDDIDQPYLSYLNEYLLTERYDQLSTKQKSGVKSFINDVLKRAQIKIEKMQQQDPNGGPGAGSTSGNMSSMMGTLKKTVMTSYKDAPPDIQRQIEQMDGLTPSGMGNQAMPYQLPNAGKALGTIHNTTHKPAGV
jgi:hypothetical protein